MYRFSFVENVSGKATEVTREMFHDIIRRKKIAATCRQIAEQQALLDGAADDEARKAIQMAISRLKRSLPAFCWHAWFDEGKRKNYAAHPSGLVMIDVDHVAQPRELFAQLEAPAKDAGLLAAHITPSTKGLRLVFPVPEGMDLEKAQTHYVKTLKLKNVDACTKDPARLSFCVPEEYFLFVEEDTLFNEENGNGNVNGNRRSSESRDELAQSMPSRDGGKDAQRLNGNVNGNSLAAENELRTGTGTELRTGTGTLTLTAFDPETGAERTETAEGLNPFETSETAEGLKPSETAALLHEPAEGMKPFETSETAEGLKPSETVKLETAEGTETAAEPLTSPFPSSYETGQGGNASVPYTLIVESLQELMGGIPAHGSRNNFIFSMAAYLRYVCNDDPDWIARILPTYGETAEKWRRTIDSACQRAQYKVMPQIVKRAIANAQKKQKDSALALSDDLGDDLPPEMPQKLPRLIAHLVKNVPEVCRPAVANAVFPSLAAHLHGVKFQLIDGTEKEATFMCVTMAKQSSGKSAINKPIEYITADIVERDEINRRREQEWKDASATKGANKEKPKRPDDLCVQVLVSDMTNAAFVQRMKDAGGKYLYTNLEELDLLKQLQTNGTKDVGKIICLCFDNGKYGQERVGTQSVTARVDVRWNWNAASTIQKGIQFFRGRLVDGTLSRVNFCTIIPDKTKPFVYGHYDEKYAETLKPFITNLNLANGLIECKPALDLARRLAEQCAEEGTLSDDDVYQDLAYRAVTIAYLKAMVLYIANDMTWTKDIADFAEWSLHYDLWCKSHFFGDPMYEAEEEETVKRTRGRQNLLELLPTTFTLQDALTVRQLQGLNDSGCRHMIAVWISRGYIDFDSSQGIYIKTEKYLERNKRE